mmetsp:Transcript_60058/g.72184  ORF Transcript_60058/g.72184 Transcript_60058/m.72184 type:complete len:160 (-) Transcript_60058:274-753(-)
MIYARFLTFIIATLSFQRVVGEGTCAEDLVELTSNPKYIEYTEAIGQESMVCSTDASKCDFPDSKKMCTDMNAVFYVITMTKTCDGIPTETRTPFCYPECYTIDDLEQIFEDASTSNPDCTISIDIDGGGTSAAFNFSLNTIAVTIVGMLLHFLAEAMM